MGVHARQFGIQEFVVVAHFQELGVGDFDDVGHVGVAARFVDEGAVPGEDDEVVFVVRESVAEQVGAGGGREGAVFAGEQGGEVDAGEQGFGGGGVVAPLLVERMDYADQVIFLDAGLGELAQGAGQGGGERGQGGVPGAIGASGPTAVSTSLIRATKSAQGRPSAGTRRARVMAPKS